MYGEASVLPSLGLVFYSSAALSGLYQQVQRACCCRVVAASIRLYRKTGQWTGG
jgi:hypothetical protein